MSDSETDRIHRALKHLMETAGDNCSLCGRALADGEVTAGGVGALGVVHLVGACCANKLTEVAVRGRYMAPGSTPEDIMRRAGSATVKPNVSMNPNTPWQADDREWFARNPSRAHRVRAPFEGEERGLLPASNKPPEGHETWVIVRQVEPGKRVRLPFFHNCSAEIPDIDAALAALFDLVLHGPSGRVISAKDVAASVQLANSGAATN